MIIVLPNRDSDHYNQTDLKFVMPAFALKELRKAVATIDPVTAHQINQQLCHAFLKRYLIKGLKILGPFLLIILKPNFSNILDPACR